MVKYAVIHSFKKKNCSGVNNYESFLLIDIGIYNILANMADSSRYFLLFSCFYRFSFIYLLFYI